MTTPVTNVVTLENFRDNFFPGSPGTSAISSYGSSSFKIGDAQKSVQKNQGGDCRPGPTPSVESKLFDGSESSRKTRFHRFGCIKNLGEILGETNVPSTGELIPDF